MSKKIYICNPTGNITALVQGERDLTVADTVMKKNPQVEQVGFLTDGGKTLTMAGGEFCGNASMSAGALYCKTTGEKSVSLAVSGADEPVLVTVDGVNENGYNCTVKMPGRAVVTAKKLPLPEGEAEVPVIEMPGIFHAVFEGNMDRDEAGMLVKKWCEALDAPAMGIMFFNERETALTPLVYVPAAKTLFWESSCASGSAALGAYLAKKQNSPVEKEISEPGGKLSVKAFPNGEVYLSGSVIIEEISDLI